MKEGGRSLASEDRVVVASGEVARGAPTPLANPITGVFARVCDGEMVEAVGPATTPRRREEESLANMLASARIPGHTGR